MSITYVQQLILFPIAIIIETYLRVKGRKTRAFGLLLRVQQSCEIDDRSYRISSVRQKSTTRFFLLSKLFRRFRRFIPDVPYSQINERIYSNDL